MASNSRMVLVYAEAAAYKVIGYTVRTMLVRYGGCSVYTQTVGVVFTR